MARALPIHYARFPGDFTPLDDLLRETFLGVSTSHLSALPSASWDLLAQRRAQVELGSLSRRGPAQQVLRDTTGAEFESVIKEARKLHTPFVCPFDVQLSPTCD